MHSGEVLLALTRAGIAREDAYSIVQRNAMATWSALGQAGGRSFRDNLAKPTPMSLGKVSELCWMTRCGRTGICAMSITSSREYSRATVPPQSGVNPPRPDDSIA